MKILIALAMLFCSCATPLIDARNVDFEAVEREVKGKLKLYPSGLKYDVKIVATEKDVQLIYGCRGGLEEGVRGLYLAKEKQIIIPAKTLMSIIRHEIGHAIVDAYFTEPVPRWLHEEIARKAEEKK